LSGHKDISSQLSSDLSKKKRVTSYKTLMAGFTNGFVKNDVELEKEKDALRKVTGGGNFTKIDKI